MRPLLTLSARWMFAATFLVLAAGIGAGLVRLLPWLVAPEVPLALAAPFAEELARAALDVAILLGLPVGASTAAALFVESGGARCLMALGATPARLAGPVALVGLAFTALSAAVSVPHWGVDSPSRFATRLIDAGRASCDGAATPRVDLPLVGAAWLCFSSSPRFVGRVPGLGEGFVYSAARVVAEDSRTVEFRDMHAAGVLRNGPLVHVKAASARLAGLPSFGSTRSQLRGAARAVVVSGSATLVALGMAWLVIRKGSSRPVQAASAAAAAAILLLLAFRELDRRALGPALPEIVRSDR